MQAKRIFRFFKLVGVGVACLATTAPGAAQVYSEPSPAPRTTDAAALRALAKQREARELVGLAFQAELRGDWAAAKAPLEQVIAAAPPEPLGSTAYYDLGVAQAHVSELQAAAASFRAAIERDPGFLAARANLVGVELERGDLRAARTAADDFVQYAPRSARALYARGLTALQQGDGRTAAADFTLLLSENATYAVGRYDLALAEIQLNRFEDAERELRGALAVAPTYARARFALATVLLREGRKGEARDELAEAAKDAADPSLRTLALSLRDSIEQ